MRRPVTALLTVLLSAALGACSSSDAPEPVASSGGEAVVIVSGLATQTPFTTTTAACTQGQSAGNTASALRDGLIAAGHQVFTAPAQSGPGQVTDTSGVGSSSSCPNALPAQMTIDTTADIDAGGRRLAGFLRYLAAEYGVTDVHLVGHSMGGLFSRAATGELHQGEPRVRSLTALGTPWTGAYPADYGRGDLRLSACAGDSTCRQVLDAYKSTLVATEPAGGAATAISTHAMQGLRGWNEAQGADLAGIPVTLIAGDHYRKSDGSRTVWPNDAIVALDSALARGIDGRPLEIRGCLVRPDVHTIGLAEQAGLPWTSSLTWDPEVITAVEASVDGHGPDRSQCRTR